MENEKLQEIAMMIIASAGESKGLSFNAIEEAKKGNFTEAEKTLENASQALVSAAKSLLTVRYMTASVC